MDFPRNPVMTVTSAIEGIVEDPTPEKTSATAKKNLAREQGSLKLRKYWL
jgi:hypothetical protein